MLKYIFFRSKQNKNSLKIGPRVLFYGTKTQSPYIIILVPKHIYFFMDNVTLIKAWGLISKAYLLTKRGLKTK